MNVNTLACDVCGVQFSSSGYALKRVNGGLLVAPLDGVRGKSGYIHLCGQNHLMKKLTVLLTETSFEYGTNTNRRDIPKARGLQVIAR